MGETYTLVPLSYTCSSASVADRESRWASAIQIAAQVSSSNGDAMVT